MTPEDYAAFLRKAFDAYIDIHVLGTDAPTTRSYLPYGTVDLDAIKWHGLGGLLVKDELRELTNNLNAWLSALRSWQVWLLVCDRYSKDEQWELEHAFITPVATYCLFQPSAIRDTFTFVVTNGIHQVLLAVDSTYKDRLPLDRAPWEPPTYPSRRRKEKQLESIVNRWSEGHQFLQNLCCLDDKATRNATYDFRNRASHGIAPRFSLGMTHAVTRAITQATRLEDRGDGMFHDVPVPGAQAVSYSYGGMQPLDLKRVLETNMEQFELAAACFDNYVSMLKAASSGAISK